MLLVCNAPDGVDAVLDGWRANFGAARLSRVNGLLSLPDVSNMKNDPRYLAGIAAAESLLA
jgi:hypothetical protein